MKVALVQMMVSKLKKDNIDRAVSFIEEAADNGTDVVVLPEMFNCPYDNAYFEPYSEVYPGETSMRMMDVAKKKGIYLIAGSIPEKDEGKVYNTSYVYSPKGQLIGRHRKMHLFDINIKGGQYFMESDVLTAGSDFTVFDTEFGKIGLGICFDIRFPEYFRVLENKGARIIVLPAAFNMTTGPKHWEISLRMRAIDNQIFMVACSPARNNKSSYVSYAHSMVVDPIGDVILDLGIDEKIDYVDIDLKRIDDVREQLPLIKNSRRDMYRVSYCGERDEKKIFR